MFKNSIRIICLLAACAGLLAAQQNPTPFDDAHWNLAGAKVVDHMGRSALMGFAVLKNVEFENGVIEYDLAVTGARSYPGVIFRSHPDGSWERFYIRPHRSGRVAPSLYSDVLQYLPAWNRVDSWQIYSGKGYTAGAVIPADRWFHVKIEVMGDRARVFVDNGDQPGLEIPHLRHGQTKGGIALMGPADGSAYYSNFSIRSDDALNFGPPPRQDIAPGFIRSWQVSQSSRALEVDDSGSSLPASFSVAQWQDVQCDEYGLLDIARIHGRSGQPDMVFLKTIIHADRNEVRPYKFGYSDLVGIYLNGTKIYTGDSTYQGRDPSFLGIIGLNDIILLPLKTGDNELVVSLTEIMGGWGFEMQRGDAEYRASGITTLWKTPKQFAIPESVAYDPVRQALYVSNYDPFNPSGQEGHQVINKLGLQGGEPQVLVQGLRNPTGLAVYKESIFAVESNSVAEIDIAKGQIIRRFEIADSAVLNDIAIDGDGTLYVSDLPQGVIYRIAGGKVEAWLRGPEVSRPNGVCVSGNQLVWANNGDGKLKSVDLKNLQIKNIADLSGGIIDGVANGLDGSWLVSHNEGRLFQVSAAGQVTLVLDLTVPGTNIADFTYILEKNMVVIPTFYDNRVIAESIPPMANKK